MLLDCEMMARVIKHGLRARIAGMQGLDVIFVCY
jgi:hypothetical protein